MWATKKEQKITITASTGLKDEEIDKMVEEASKHAEEDKKKKERVEKKNEADTLCFSVEKLIKENGDKIEDGDKKNLTEKSDELKKLIEKDDFDQAEVEKKTEELMSAMQEVGKKMYEKAAKEAPKEEPKADDSSKKKDEEKAQEGEVVE